MIICAMYQRLSREVMNVCVKTCLDVFLAKLDHQNYFIRLVKLQCQSQKQCNPLLELSTVCVIAQSLNRVVMYPKKADTLMGAIKVCQKHKFVRKDKLVILTCKGPKLESESLYLFSCILSPQPWFKLPCQTRASIQGVRIYSVSAAICQP